MSDAYTLAAGTPIGQRFLIDAPVGAGAQGEVYRAQDRNVRGHRVAIKLMRHPARTEDQRTAAMRELELLSAVHHPSVLHFLDYGWHEGRLWFAMPWLEGETLEEMVLSRQEAKPVFEKLAAGLAALHAVGIRHQDLKPANVFLSTVTGYDELQPQLLDLGVAVRSGELMAAGSLAYFAPEVAGSWPMPDPTVDGKADVFALALTLREVLEPGTMPELPESQDDVQAFLERRATELVSPPRGRSLRYLRKSFARWLAIDPAQRPTADEFRRELDVLLQPERRRRRALWILFVASVVAAVATWGVFQLMKARTFESASVELSGQVAGRASASLTRRRTRRKSLGVAALDEEAAEAKRRAAAAADEAVRRSRRPRRRNAVGASLPAPLRMRVACEPRPKRPQRERRLRKSGPSSRPAPPRGPPRRPPASGTRPRRRAGEAGRTRRTRARLGTARPSSATPRASSARGGAGRTAGARWRSCRARRPPQRGGRPSPTRARTALQNDLSAARSELAAARATIARLEAQASRGGGGGGGGGGAGAAATRGGGPTATPAP
ncbi:MAG: serine/threonine-protein kinase [Polyangiales bacterium]